MLCWKPERVAGDLELSGRLMLQLDQEKGVEGNPLAYPSADAAGAPAEPTFDGISDYWWTCGAATARRSLLLGRMHNGVRDQTRCDWAGVVTLRVRQHLP